MHELIKLDIIDVVYISFFVIKKIENYIKMLSYKF